MRVLVTGAAGFIGSNVVRTLLQEFEDVDVLGIDSMDSYHDVALKEYRLEGISGCDRFEFVKGDITDKTFLNGMFETFRPEYVLHFAAKVGVRHSVERPDEYVSTNIVGFHNVLESCRIFPVRHLVYASSSSVYGLNSIVPYSVEDRTDSPVSLYAATKKSNELMAHSYSCLYGIPVTGLRFFTVYGPAGRPDMAYFSFTDKLAKGGKIRLFNEGECRRDFTYVDDVVEGVMRVLRKPPKGHEGKPACAVYNVGNGQSVHMTEFVRILKEELVAAGILPEDMDFESCVELAPMQPGDVPVTCADTDSFERDMGFRPSTPLRDGLRAFAHWYSEYYN